MRMIHPTRGEAEFVLSIYCDDHAPPELVDHLGWWPNKRDAVGFLHWLDMNGSLQTPFGERFAAELRAGGAEVDLGGWSGTPRDMDYGFRLRFACEECGKTLPCNGRRFAPILERVRLLGVTRMSLQDIERHLK